MVVDGAAAAGGAIVVEEWRKPGLEGAARMGWGAMGGGL